MLNKETFISWLQSLPTDVPIQESTQIAENSCPIKCFFSSRGDNVSYVSRYGYFDLVTEAYIKLPEWAVSFIAEIDELVIDEDDLLWEKVTPQHCLSFLQESVNNGESQ